MKNKDFILSFRELLNKFNITRQKNMTKENKHEKKCIHNLWCYTGLILGEVPWEIYTCLECGIKRPTSINDLNFYKTANIIRIPNLDNAQLEILKKRYELLLTIHSPEEVVEKLKNKYNEDVRAQDRH